MLHTFDASYLSQRQQCIPAAVNVGRWCLHAIHPAHPLLSPDGVPHRLGHTHATPVRDITLVSEGVAVFTPPNPWRSWNRFGRLETRKNTEAWSCDGQCVVVHQELLATAAHVCFHTVQVKVGRQRIGARVPFRSFRAVFCGLSSWMPVGCRPGSRSSRSSAASCDGADRWM